MPTRSPADSSILDVGCGTGALMAFLEEKGFRVSGLESNPEASRFARKEFGLNVELGSIYEHGLTGESYDVVVSTAAIEHFTNPLEALRRMRSLLRPGGHLYINTQDFRGMVLKKGLGHWFKFVHTYYYTETTLISLIEQAGFQVQLSWTMPPVLKNSFVYPGNYCSGELNVVAVKQPDGAPVARHRCDDVQNLFAAYEQARHRDRLDALVARLRHNRWLDLPFRVAGRLFRAPVLFASFFLPNGEVDRQKLVVNVVG